MLFNKAVVILSVAAAASAKDAVIDHRLRGMKSPTANVAAPGVHKYIETNGGILDTNKEASLLKDDSGSTVRLMTQSELEVFEAQIREYHDRPMEFIPRTPFGATYGGVDLTDRIATETSDVVCGGHSAATCADCPFSDDGTNHGAGWCNGDCFWNSETSACQDTDPNEGTEEACTADVLCGGHYACSCALCTIVNGHDYGSGYCNGDCAWNAGTLACEVPPAKDCGGGVFADDCTACETTSDSTCSSTDCESMPSPDDSKCRYVLTNEARSASEYLNFNTIPVSHPAWWFQRLDMLAAASSTFFATNGHSFGYSGFQVSTESPLDGRILFSIWDQGGCDRDVDPSCPEAQTAQTIACGTGIKCDDFGGEGTGRKSIVYSDTLPILDTPYYIVTYARSRGEGTYRMQYSSFFYVPGSDNWDAKKNETDDSYTSTPPGWRFLSTIEVGTNANDEWWMSSMYSFLEQWTEADGLEHRSGLFGPHYVAGETGDFEQITQATFNHGTTENFKHVNAFMNGEAVGMEMGGSVTKSANHGDVFTVPAAAEPAELVSFKVIKTCLETLSLSASTEEVEGCLTATPSATPSPTSPAASTACNAKKLKITSTSGKPIALLEIRVYSDGLDVTSEGTATESSEQGQNGPENAIDNSDTDYSHTKWSDSNDWWQLEMNSLTSITSVEIDNISQTCRISNADMTLLDENDNVIATVNLGNTCGKTLITENFEC